MPATLCRLILPRRSAGGADGADGADGPGGDGEEEQILLCRTGDGWSLPAVALAGDWLAAEVEAVRAQVRAVLGVDATVLRQLGAAGGEVFAELEWQAPGGSPAAGGGGFFGRADGAVLAALPAAQRRVVEGWFESAGGPAAGAPWERRGWFGAAVEWMDARLAAARLPRRGPVRQVKAAWAGSAVLAAATAGGDCYFKATAGTPGEARVVLDLAARWSDRLPVVVAADAERGWLLTRDMLGAPLPAPARQEALRSFAEIQAGEAARLAHWRDLGCRERGPAEMAAAAPRLLCEIPRLLARGGALADGVAAELADALPAATALCRRLHGLGPPLSIHHEDLRGDNVVLSRGRPVFFDWADTVIAHPFFSLQRFLDDAAPPGPPGPPAPAWDGLFAADDPRSALRDAYLETWQETVPRARLLEAFRVTRQLQPLYQLLRYDGAVDLAAWLAAGPPADELDLAAAVIGAVLEASRTWAR
jgi:hypothetical protein